MNHHVNNAGADGSERSAKEEINDALEGGDARSMER